MRCDGNGRRRNESLPSIMVKHSGGTMQLTGSQNSVFPIDVGYHHYNSLTDRAIVIETGLCHRLLKANINAT